MLHHACTMCKSDFSFAVLQLLAMGLMPGFPFKIQHSYNLPCICIFAIACCWCFFCCSVGFCFFVFVVVVVVVVVVMVVLVVYLTL